MIAWLAETLIATTGLLLLVLILRNPVRQQFGAKAAYALWLMPAGRMVMPPIDRLVPDSSAIADVAHPGALSHLIRAQMTQLHVSPGLSSPGDEPLLWPFLLAGLWLIGTVAFLLWQLIDYRRFTRTIIANARPRRSPRKGVRLLASPRVKGPMAFGITRRFIVFPHDALMRFDVEEHAMALTHELAHHRRGDLLANVLALGFLGLHWWNPLAWMAHRAFRTDQEMACDADVIRAVRDQGLGHAYGRALVKCASGRDFSAICHLATADRLKRRLSMLSKNSPGMGRRLAGLGLTASVVLSGLALTASGEGVAAQMGAKMSAALPTAHTLPTLSDLSAAMTAESKARPVHGSHAGAGEARERMVQAAEDAAEASLAARSGVGAVALPPSAAPAAPRLSVPPSPPTPPQPPVPPGLAEAPPVPPAPPVPFSHMPRAIPTPPPAPPPHGYGPGAHSRDFARIPSRAEIDAMVPIVAVIQGRGCTATRDMTQTREEMVTVNGHQRRKITIKTCGRDVQQHAQAQALRGLEAARADIAADGALSASRRGNILVDLDRQIARMRARLD